MQQVKKIYIHLGCGKTGSSALQVWLSNSVTELKAQGVSYPLHKSEPLKDYTITPGNGVGFTNAIFDRNAESYFKRWSYQFTEEKILFSSERFQLLKPDDWRYLLSFTDKHSIEVQIIAFVRDVYDITYSSYQQLIKRNTYPGSFKDFALSQKNLRQFLVAEQLSKLDIRVDMFHYDEIMREGQALSLSLAKVIEVDSTTLPLQKKTKVNRSLSVFESQFMQLANTYYREAYNQPCSAFSSAMSDRLINSDPELDTEIIYDSAIIEHLTTHMQSQIDMVNNSFLKQSTLQICNKTNKPFCDHPAPLNEDYKRVVRILLEPDIVKYHPDNLDKNGLPKKKSLNLVGVFHKYKFKLSSM